MRKKLFRALFLALRPVLAAGFCLGACLLQARELLPNPGIEKTSVKNGRERPEHIAVNHWGKSEGSGGLDRKIFHGGKSSAFLVKTNGVGWSGLQFDIPGFKPEPVCREVALSLWLKTEKCLSGSVVLTGDSAGKSQLLWHSVFSFKGTFDWKQFKSSVTVPAEVRKLSLSIRLNKPGKLWADDLALAWKPAEGPLLYNGDFEAGFDRSSGAPDGWTKREFEGWETDAEAALEKPGNRSRAALKIFWKSGGAKYGVASALLRAGKERRHTVSCDFKSTAACPGGIAVEFFDAAGRAAGSAASEPFDNPVWQPRRFTFKLPDGAASFRILLLLQGNGTVWYDNVRLRTALEAATADFPLEGSCVSVDASLIWNKGKAVFNTFADSPVPLTLRIKGRKREFKNPALVVEIPAELDIPQCFEPHTDFRNPVKPEIRRITRENRPYLQYRFSDSHVWGQIQPGYAWYRALTMAVMPRAPEAVGKSFTLFWHLENNGVKGKEKSFTVNILPPLPEGPLPRDFRLGFWGSHSMDFPDEKLFLQAARKYEAGNMTFRQRSTRMRDSYDKILRKRGWRLTGTAWAADYGFRGGAPAGYFKVPGHEKIAGKMRFRMMRNGSLHKGKLCPEYFLKDPDYRSFAEKAAKARLDIMGCQPGDTVFLDSEPWGPMDWCFDEPCRKAFAAFAKLPAVPSAGEIVKKHAGEWIGFRTAQSTACIARLAELVRKAIPGARVVDYDYPMPFGTGSMEAHLRGCAKDSLRNEAYIDGHLSSYYHTLDTRGFDMMRRNMAYLKKPYSVILALDDASTYLTAREVLSPRRFRLHLTMAAALGARDAWVYANGGSETDGLFFAEGHKAMAEIAALQEFFATPEVPAEAAVTVGGTKDLTKLPVRFAVHRKGKALLVSLFNCAEEKSFPFELAPVSGKKFRAEDPFTGKILPGLRGKTFSGSIAPMSALHIRLIGE